jgi:DNA gyrase/topoisomerase IV subunit A
MKPLLARNLKVGDHHLLSHPARTFSAYEQQLEDNLRLILRKYAHLDRQKVSDLLEELDNNCQLAMQILEEEQTHCNSILEERREGRHHPALSQQEENRILKQSFLNLYKKLLATTE